MKPCRVIAPIMLLLAAAVTAEPNYELVRMWETRPVLAVSECVLLNPDNSQLYVSCISGEHDGKDGNGFIARINLEGEVVDLKWATGLNAPKGMAISGDSLYVSDLDELVRIDLGTGRIAQRYPAPGATYLNDVAADADGNVYVSNSSREGSGVYRLQDGKLELWLKPPAVDRPNGLLVIGDRLLVGDESGRLQSIDLNSGNASLIARTDAGIDGLKPDGKGNYFTSNWKGRTTLITADGKTIVLMDTSDANVNSADFEYLEDQQLLIIPTFFDNRVVAYRVTVKEGGK